MSAINATVNDSNFERVPTPLSLNRIFQTWWPLTASWTLMMVETVIVTIIIARMFAPAINLAAWGIAQPITMILGAAIMPIISASAALCKDWASYLRVRSYLLAISITLTILHFLLTFTPLYDLIIVPLIGIPPEVIEPTRWGLSLFLPYSFGMGIRRLNHGIFVRFGRSDLMLFGTFVRLGVDLLVLALVFFTDSISSISISSISIVTATVSIGVIAEMLYTVWKVNPIVNNQLKTAPPTDKPMDIPTFISFYLPMVSMSVLYMTLLPLVSSGLTRMPNPIDSLAVWPVIRTIVIMMACGGFAYIEVVVVLLDEPNSLSGLRRFAWYSAGGITAVMLLMSLTPLGDWWFRELVSLPPSLVPLAKHGLWILTLSPGLIMLQHWYQGVLVNSRATRGIAESFILSLLGMGIPLFLGVLWGGMHGITIGMFSYLMGDLTRAGWLWYRARPIIEAKNQKQRQVQYA